MQKRSRLRGAWASLRNQQPQGHITNVSSHSSSGHALSPTEVFELLDGRCLESRGNRWQVRIYSVVDQGRSRWIQLAVEGVRRHVLTMRVSSSSGPDRLIRALGAWLTNPADDTRAGLTVANALGLMR